MIRQLSAQDQPQLRRLAYMAAYNPDPANQGPEIEKAVELWTTGFGEREGDLGVCFEKGGVHGVCWIRLRSPALVENTPQLLLAVDMIQRGQGVEKQLLEAMLQLADQSGITRLSLITSPNNKEDFMLYSNHGFANQGSTEMGNMIMVRET